MGQQALAHTHPPELQEVAQAINNVVAPKARVPIVAEVVPTLAFTISIDQVLRRIFWSFDEFLMTGANTRASWLWPQVPQSETRRYLHVWVDEPRVKPTTFLSILYPSQGVIAETVGGVIAIATAANDDGDFLSPGTDTDKKVYPGLPVDVFPAGRLKGIVNQDLAAGDTIKVLTVWERLAPPNTARAELDPLTFVEF